MATFIASTLGTQHASVAFVADSEGAASSPKTGIVFKLWNVSHAMPCGSTVQYLLERA